MKRTFSFTAPSSPEETRTRLLAYLSEIAGFHAEGEEEGVLSFRRGSRRARIWSSRIEEWPCMLKVALQPGGRGTIVQLAYDVSTGWHLVGALEKAVLEAEAALIRDHLRRGSRLAVGKAVATLRRPVLVAMVLNALLAMVVVAAIGTMAGFAPLGVGLVALAVGLLDAITIAAFADLVVEGLQAVPRLGPDHRFPAPFPEREKGGSSG